MADPIGVAGLVVSVAGSLVSIGGLTLTYLQAKGAKSAAEEARAAVARTEEQLAKNNLLFLVPQMFAGEGDFEAAVRSDDSESALRHSTKWRSVAAELCGLLQRPGQTLDQDLADALASALDIAAEAKLNFFQGGVSLSDATAKTRHAMSHAGDLAGQLAGRMRVSGGGQ